MYLSVYQIMFVHMMPRVEVLKLMTPADYLWFFWWRVGVLAAGNRLIECKKSSCGCIGGFILGLHRRVVILVCFTFVICGTPPFGCSRRLTRMSREGNPSISVCLELVEFNRVLRESRISVK